MATKQPIIDPMIAPRTGEYAVIAPGHNFKSVTKKIAGIVLPSNTPLGWFFGLIIAGGVATGAAASTERSSGPGSMTIARRPWLRQADTSDATPTSPAAGDPSQIASWIAVVAS